MHGSLDYVWENIILMAAVIESDPPRTKYHSLIFRFLLPEALLDERIRHGRIGLAWRTKASRICIELSRFRPPLNPAIALPA